PAETVFQPAEGPPTNLQLRLVPRTSTVLIDSDPRGAAVLAGGVEVGITPVTITTFTPSSEVAVTFRHGGYAEVTRSIRVPSPGGEAQVMQSLTMDPAYATLVVTSEPAGAEVWIDGQRKIGVTTPTKELLVEASKRHTVGLRLPKHAPVNVSVSPGQGARNVPVHGRLVRGAAIAISANLDARVTVAGVKACIKRPLPFDCPVPAGKYQVDIETTKMTGKVRRMVEVKDDTVEVALELGWVEAPSGKQLVFGGHQTSRVAFEEGKRSVAVFDEAEGTTSMVDVRVQPGRATALP
ncbi:MAG: PEGA domain-containing protein, partial [Deltaproteobacteria bacterium]|nr:PEGA domain-containing protein [Kofleriaceae bacterium]